jgi:hypothetical protein
MRWSPSRNSRRLPDYLANATRLGRGIEVDHTHLGANHPYNTRSKFTRVRSDSGRKQQEFCGPHDDHGTTNPSFEFASKPCWGTNYEKRACRYDNNQPRTGRHHTDDSIRGFFVQIQPSRSSARCAQLETPWKTQGLEIRGTANL